LIFQTVHVTIYLSGTFFYSLVRLLVRFIGPLLVVKDIQNSTHFYRDILAQKVKYDFGENVAFEGNFSIHLESHYLKLLGPIPSTISFGSHNFELYFESEDIEASCNQLLQHGVIFIHHIVEQPWKQRVVRFYDPDNHIVEIGESMESVIQRLAKDGQSVEQIHQATSMPIDFIRSVVI